MFESDMASLENAVTQIVKSCDDKMLSIATQSQKLAAESLGAGDTVPYFGAYEPATEAAAQEMSATISGGLAKIREAVAEFEGAVNRKVSAAPDPNDLAAVSFALSKSSNSEQELRALYTTYGHSYQLAAAISDRAAQLGYTVTEPQTIDAGAAEETALYILANRYAYAHNSHTLMQPMTDATDVSRRTMNALKHLDAFGKPARHY